MNKIYLNHMRLSEDLDFTCRKDIKKVKREITGILDAGGFHKHEFDKQTGNYFRLKVFYKSYFNGESHVILDVNRNASVFLSPQPQEIKHFYDEIPKFKICTLNIKELMAEKVRALITRNQPRDYFDVYVLLENGHKPDFDLIKKKLKEAGQEFEIERIFKNAKRIYSGWNSEIGQLTNRQIEYITVIKYLQKAFKYKG